MLNPQLLFSLGISVTGIIFFKNLKCIRFNAAIPTQSKRTNSTVPVSSSYKKEEKMKKINLFSIVCWLWYGYIIACFKKFCNDINKQKNIYYNFFIYAILQYCIISDFMHLIIVHCIQFLCTRL